MNSSLIASIPLFASLSAVDRERLSDSLIAREMGAGTILIREGEPGDCFYIILSGQVEIVKALGTADERLLATRGHGEFVGEMSLINPHGLRTASVRAPVDVSALELARHEFERLLNRHPALGFELVRALSRYLDASNNSTIRDLHEKNRQLTEAFEELKAAQAQIVEKEKLERELAVAREIQQSILPASLPHLAGFEFGARMTPARAVGGDLYDFIELGEGRVGVAVGDVSDKGVPAAIFMALTTSLLRAEASRAGSPDEALRNVNRHLLGMNGAGMFVTVLYGVLDGASQTFHYARAGHELPLLVDKSGTAAQIPQGVGAPLGLFPDFALDVQTIVVAPGSTLVIHTDGVGDALSIGQERFGMQRLKDVIRAQSAAGAQAVCNAVVQAVDAFAAEVSQFDDITIVAMQNITDDV